MRGSRGLDITYLGSGADRLFEAGLAESTRKTYRTGAQRYRDFCQRVGKIAFPVREDVIVLFVARLHLDGVAPGTMKCYLAAVRYAQICRRLGDPAIKSMPRVEYVLKGAKRLKPGAKRQ